MHWLKVAALASLLLIGLSAFMPLTATAPEAEDELEDCADNGVCFIVLLTDAELSLSGPPDFVEGSNNFDAWLYVENPSENIERDVAIGGSGEDNVVVDATILTFTDPAGDTVGPLVGVLETFFFPDRFDPVVHAFETKRVFFFGFAFFPGPEGPGVWFFEVGVILTFRGETFTLSVDFEIDVAE